MTLEAALAANTAALTRLADILSATPPAVAAAQPAPADEPKPAKAEKPVEVDTPEDKPVTYAEVADAVITLKETKGTTAAIEFLAAYGVKTAKHLKPEQWPDALAAAKKAVA